MSSCQRINDVCRTCLSTDGELISLFSENRCASRITKKIMSISHILIDKEDGLPEKICRKCIYLVESFNCFKQQLISADKKLKEIWDNGRVNIREGRVSENEPVIGQSENIEYNEPAFGQREDIEHNEPAFGQNEYSEHDELDYDIKWISDEVRIEVEKAFRRKWANELKKKLEETKILQNVENEELLPSNDIENKNIKTEKLDDCIEEDIVRSEETEESMEKEAIETENLNYSIKKESIETEELNGTVESEKSDIEKNSKDAKEQEDSNIIVISDSSDERDSNFLRKALSTVPTNFSGVIGNGNASMNPRGGRKRIIRARVTANSKNVSKLGKKEGSSSLKIASAKKINFKSRPRKFFQCTRCNVNLYTVAAVLLHHNQVHTPNKASLCCRMCDKTFPAKSELFAHFNRHVESHLFRCSYCPNEFVLKKNLMEHMNNHKKRAELSKSKSPNKRARISSENSIEDYRELKQYTKKKNISAVPGKASEDSEKQDIDANLQVPITQDLDNNAMDQEEDAEKENHITTASSAVPVVGSVDKHLMK